MSQFFIVFPGSNKHNERPDNQQSKSSEYNSTFPPKYNSDEQDFFESPNNRNWNNFPPQPSSYFNTKSNPNDKFYGFRNQSGNYNNNRYSQNKSDKDIFDV